MIFERSEQASIFIDATQMLLSYFVLRMGLTETLILNWAMGEIPFVVNVGRSIMHKRSGTPDAKVWQFKWWKGRDWTYVTRPRGRQPKEIAVAPLPPMELDPDMKIPFLIRKLSEAARAQGRKSPIGIFEAWLCGRSRVIGAIFDHAVFASAFVVPMAKPVLMVINRVMVLVPGALGVFIGLRNYDKPGSVLRALRGGAFQHDGDIIVTSPDRAPEDNQAPEHKAPSRQGFAPRTTATRTVPTKSCCQRCCAVKSKTVHAKGQQQTEKVTPQRRLTLRPSDRGVE